MRGVREERRKKSEREREKREIKEGANIRGQKRKAKAKAKAKADQGGEGVYLDGNVITLLNEPSEKRNGITGTHLFNHLRIPSDFAKIFQHDLLDGVTPRVDQRQDVLECPGF